MHREDRLYKDNKAIMQRVLLPCGPPQISPPTLVTLISSYSPLPLRFAAHCPSSDMEIPPLYQWQVASLGFHNTLAQWACYCGLLLPFSLPLSTTKGHNPRSAPNSSRHCITPPSTSTVPCPPRVLLVIGSCSLWGKKVDS